MFDRTFGEVASGAHLRRGEWGWLKSAKAQKKIGVVFSMLILSAGLVFFLFPIYWMIVASLKTLDEVFLFPPSWWPSTLQWRNYPEALTFMPFGRYALNTIVITGANVIGVVLSCSLVAFAFARLRARGRDVLFLFVLSTMMLPPQVTMIPVYLLFQRLGMVDTYWPLVLPAFLATSPFSIFLLRQFFMTIPKELDEAALIDGCGYFGIWWRVVLPTAKPALLTVALFTFTAQWNDLLGPLIYLNSYDKLTLALGLANFRAMYGATPWHLLMAASIVVVAPCLFVYGFCQRYFMQGIVITGSKG